jgi:hypothetical protein
MRTFRWMEDDRGAITVIATFFSALIVGLIWYTLGLGEAMIYREQVREAADAVAFDAATMHALGMNMVAMINVTMAAVLAVLLAFTVFLFIMIGLTLLNIVCDAVPLLDFACLGETPALVAFDREVWDACVDVRKVVFGPTLNIPGIIPVLNWTEGFVGILMPWVARGEVQSVALEYPNAVATTGIFSPSMVFTRVPILSNYVDEGINNNLYRKLPFSLPKLATKVPTGSNLALKTASAALDGSQLRITDLQRFGLPIQLDKFAILCDHAGNELVQMLAFLVGELFGGEGEAFVNAAHGMGDIFGLVVGAAPGVFCTGANPVTMLTDSLQQIPFIGGLAARKAQSFIDSHFSGLSGGTPEPLVNPNPFTNPEPPKLFSEESWQLTIDQSITSMKMFDMAENGDDWFAVYSTVEGRPQLTVGALTGVQVATWGAPSASPIGLDDDIDGSQAEFYFDCGNTATNGNDEGLAFLGTGLGTPFGPTTANDMSPSWSSCKYAAPWNMRWKARLRRVHPFEYDVGQSIGVLLYNLTGIESGVSTALGAFQIGKGTEVKLAGLDLLKSDFKKWVDDVLPNNGNITIGASESTSFH